MCPGLDGWVNLTRVDPDEEVQGEIHLGLELHRDTKKTCLHCHIIEARSDLRFSSFTCHFTSWHTL